MTNPNGIAAFIDQCKRWIENYQKTLKVKRTQYQAHQSGIEESHISQPDLPLEIGSELLITDDLVKMHRNLSNALGRVVTIDAISIKEKEVIKASAFGIQVDVNMSVAQQMRAAFLQRERLPL